MLRVIVQGALDHVRLWIVSALRVELPSTTTSTKYKTCLTAQLYSTTCQRPSTRRGIT